MCLEIHIDDPTYPPGGPAMVWPLGCGAKFGLRHVGERVEIYLTIHDETSAAQLSIGLAREIADHLGRATS